MEVDVHDSNLDVVTRYYGTSWQDEADFPTNYQLIDHGNSSESWAGTSVEQVILDWMTKMPSNRWPNWLVSWVENSCLEK